MPPQPGPEPLTAPRTSPPTSRSWANILDGLPAVFPVVLRGPLGIGPAVGVGLVAAAVLAVVHWRHGRTLKYVGWAIPGIAVVTAVIVLTGSARNYYLPSIVIASVNAVLLVGSAVVRRPALGYVAARMDRTRFAGWREDRRLLHVLCGLTLVWGVVIGARALVQWWLYFAENDGWLAAFRLSSTPVTLGLGFVTFVLIRRARPAPVPEPA